MYMCVCVCVCVYMYMYVHTRKEGGQRVDTDCVLLSNWDRLVVGPPLWGLSLEVPAVDDLIVTSFKSLNTDYRWRERERDSHTV